jgi:CheY-like chemotaxis protein
MAEALSAIADLIWPLLVLVLLTYLYLRRKDWGPDAKELLRTRSLRASLGGIAFEVGGQPVSAQQVVDDQRQQTEQLRKELSLLSAHVAALEEAAPPAADADLESAPPEESTLTRRVLWVDDRPSNNAYEIAALKDRGVKVELATSTNEALRRVERDSAFDAIVTDMRRDEQGETRETAGLTLLRELRELKGRGVDIPVVVYASQAAVNQHRSEALALGAVGVTATPTALLELLAVNYGPRFSGRFKRQVQSELERSGYKPVLEPRDSAIDFRAHRNDETLGIDVKSSWGRDVDASRLRAKFDAIARAGYDLPVWIVTPEPITLPHDVRPPEGVALLSLAELRARLRESGS